GPPTPVTPLRTDRAFGIFTWPGPPSPAYGRADCPGLRICAWVLADLGGCALFGALAQPPALLFGEATPDARLLVGADRELEALGGHRALAADTLRRVDLVQRAAGRPDREEELRRGVATGGAITP